MKRGLVILSAILAAAAPAGWYFKYHTSSADGPEQAEESGPSPEHKPDPGNYARLRKQLAGKRLQLAQSYRAARTRAEKDAVLKRARAVLESHLLEMAHCWRGTPWDFNGTCKTPGSGKIACGYFVSTLLRDTGVDCQRVKLAQQPSQRIIATFLPRKHMRIRAGLAYDDFLKQETARGPGWRIVGLDRHVGFLVVEPGGKIRFIHSNPGTPRVVLDEPREKSAYLRNSNYRVTGNFSANKKFLEGWLTGKVWPTKTGK